MLLLCAAACAAEPVLETKIGLEGVYYLRTAEPGLVVRQANERSPILLDIARVARCRRVSCSTSSATLACVQASTT